MARARNIKPSFFTNEKLAECEPLARLLFTGLWCIADREGRLNDIPIRIKAQVLPYDNCDCNDLLAQLTDKKLIIRYSLDDDKFIQIISFTKHQQPHYKEVASVIPSPPNWNDSGKTAGGVTESVRIKILERDGQCMQCQSKEDLTLDHIIPRSLGGSHDESNLQTLCRKCNSSKNNKLLSSSQHRANIEPTKAPIASPYPSSLLPDSPIPFIETPIPISLGLKVKNWDILRVISDKGLSKAKANAPGWDIYNLANVYNNGVTERGIPDKPDLAFSAWCAKYTKGKQL